MRGSKKSTARPSKPSTRRSGAETRERILNAAVKRFSKSSYDEVGLRDIASDVGVDVALVHRAFGSKKKLFLEAFRAVSRLDGFFADVSGDYPAQFAFDPRSKNGRSLSGHAGPLQIFVRSLSSAAARDILRSYVTRDFIERLSQTMEGPDRNVRAAMFVACLTGVGILRDVIKVDVFQPRAEIDSRGLLADVLEFCLHGGSDTPRPGRHAPDKM